MAGMTSAGMIKCLDTLTGKTAYTLPPLFMELTTTTPTWSAPGTAVTTGAWTNYARLALGATAAFNAASAGAATNASLIDFGTSSGGTGPTVVGYDIYDASSAGTRLWWGTFSPSIPVTTNTHFTIAAGALSLALSVLAAGVGFGTSWANKMIDHMSGRTTMTATTIWLGLATAASTASALGTEAAYSGYPAAASARSAIPLASLNGAAVVSTNVDVVTNAQFNYPACNGGTSSTVIGWFWADAANVGAGLPIAAGTVTSVVIQNGLTPDLPSGTTLLRLN